MIPILAEIAETATSWPDAVMGVGSFLSLVLIIWIINRD